MSQEQIFIAIKQLVEEGKEPSLALLKSRVAARLPMPMFIDAINQYKRNPSCLEQYQLVSKQIEQAPSQSLEQRVKELEQQVAELSQRLNQLEGGA